MKMVKGRSKQMAGSAVELQTTIGRPVGDAWYQDFQDQLSLEGGGSVWFTPRIAPGIHYASVDELDSVWSWPYAGESTEERITKRARWFIEGMQQARRLDPQQSSLSINLGCTKLYPNFKTYRARVVARLLDQPCDYYPEGFLCTGERVAIRRELGLKDQSTTARTREIPLLTVALGFLEATDRASITESFLKRVQKRLPDSVSLQEVDITRL